MGSGAVGIESILWHVQLVVRDNDDDDDDNNDDDNVDNDKTTTTTRRRQKGRHPNSPSTTSISWGSPLLSIFFPTKITSEKISVPPTTETFTGKKCLKLGPEN